MKPSNGASFMPTLHLRVCFRLPSFLILTSTAYKIYSDQKFQLLPSMKLSRSSSVFIIDITSETCRDFVSLPMQIQLPKVSGNSRERQNRQVICASAFSLWITDTAITVNKSIIVSSTGVLVM